ncbi:MAG TPA: exodeoxyribonuclease V subunit gamma [Nocardioidaceae bacterium]|nr:exodeoxyribonuclease V subunit gamma [Nocardioidaceae bacterium]
MPLKLHRSERADALVHELATVLTTAPDDPFTPDVVAVPSKGVERWIAQTLSTALGVASSDTGDGVCANVVFPSPGRLVREAVAAASGIAPDEDPWAERRLAWALLAVIDGCATEDWCRTLGRHLELVDGGVDQGRRMAVAQKLAGLFTAYGAQRPTMLRDWATGLDTDGFGVPLDADHLWQAELWRRLRAHVGVDSPAERMDAACATLREAPGKVDLPGRISLFGPTRLSTDQIQVVDALAAHRDVHLWLPHPSHGLWSRIAESPTTLDGSVRSRRDDPTSDVPAHPLVRSLGRDARELQLRLRAHVTLTDDEHVAGRGPVGETLLAAVQRDIHDDSAPSARHALAAQDTSVRVHACHGRQRQVEVLREVVLGLLADDPTLELRDIIVMCPDIESYAPLINATFGLAHDDHATDAGHDSRVHPGHRLSIRLADRSLRQTNPVLGVAARLLDLADARLTASEVLDLAAMPPVRRRFRLDDDALERVGDWVRRSGVRWGLDAEARRPYGLDQIRQNTWQAGLDRLLVGVTMDEDDLRTLDVALPLDDVDSTEIDLAGRLAELLDRIAVAVDSLHRDQPLDAWVAALEGAVESLVDVSPQDAWQLTQARWQLTDALTSAERAGRGGQAGDTTLTLSDVRSLLGERLKGRPTRANFRTGHLTMCTMVPMRSVPHRVVCLLGLDDGVFPRSTRVDGDDVLARSPRVGERDARAEDRQLFLDAVLAAKERLVVLYTGADERTGASRPPAVPLGELLDVLDRTAHTPAGRVRDQVVVHHPLQPFDARNFLRRGEAGRGPFSFDRASYDGSRALLAGQQPRAPFLATPLPPDEELSIVQVNELVRFLEHPVKGFLRQRLGLSILEDEEQPSDALPVSPDALEKWAVGDRLLTAGLAGIDPSTAVRAEWLRGQLPPGRLGQDLVGPIVNEVADLINRSANIRSGPAEHLDVSLTLPCGITVAGTVPGVHGDRVVRVLYSKLSPKHRLRAWVHLLALTVQWPERSWQAVTVGRDKDGNVTGAFLQHVTPEDARRHLEALVEVYRAGLTAPLPVPPKTACAYAEERRAGNAVPRSESRAARAWRTKAQQKEVGEFDDAAHRRIWGDPTMSKLLSEPADPSDPDWPDEPHRFGQLARRVWTPLLEAEAVVNA